MHIIVHLFILVSVGVGGCISIASILYWSGRLFETIYQHGFKFIPKPPNSKYKKDNTHLINDYIVYGILMLLFSAATLVVAALIGDGIIALLNLIFGLKLEL